MCAANTSHKPKAVLFDLDGTLLDTADDLAYALNLQLAAHHKPAVDPAVLRDKVSNGANALLHYGFKASPSDEGFDALRAEYLDLYLDNLAVHTKPFDGIEELIAMLDQRSIPWGIVTNKPHTYAEPLMMQFAFASQCKTLICPDHVKNKKPDPEALHLACSELDTTPDQCLYIGDHERDIECGRRAGAKTIACAYGYIEEQKDISEWQADFIAADGRELLSIVREQISSHNTQLAS